MINESQKIKMCLEEVGVIIEDIYDLVNAKTSYSNAIPVLIELLKEGIKDLGLKEGIIRSLAVKEARGKANKVLLNEYQRTPRDKMSMLWTIGNTMEVVMTKDDLKEVLSIVKNPKNGISRQMMVLGLSKFHTQEVENTLIALLKDDDVLLHVIYALGRLRSLKAKDEITLLLKHSNSVVRKEALNALKKIEKAKKK